jgi:hypothetical protein
MTRPGWKQWVTTAACRLVAFWLSGGLGLLAVFLAPD